jgi:YHS domain-containing protein
MTPLDGSLSPVAFGTGFSWSRWQRRRTLNWRLFGRLMTNIFIKRNIKMKKLIMVILGLVLALCLAVTGFAADSPAPKGQPQTVCPVLGDKIDKNIYADYQGKRVYFCCAGCVEPFKKDPGKYLKKMEEQGVTPEKTPAGK